MGAVTGDVQVRRATAGDGRTIATIHVEGWRWAYRGHIPDELLDGLSVERREAFWRRELSDPSSEVRVWLADRDGRPVGFVATGAPQDEDVAPGTAELHAIYLLEDAVGSGVGRALMARAVEHLRERGHPAATLWVLASNDRARRFYEAAGWHADGGVKRDDFGGEILEEVRYRLGL